MTDYLYMLKSHVNEQRKSSGGNRVGAGKTS